MLDQEVYGFGTKQNTDEGKLLSKKVRRVPTDEGKNDSDKQGVKTVRMEEWRSGRVVNCNPEGRRIEPQCCCF